MSRVVSGILLGLAIIAVLLIATLAMPIHEWRTGRLPVAPLPLVPGDSLAAAVPKRVWIDTDAACGHSDTTDPDDCFALLLLARDPTLQIVGISTIFGNASLDVTDATARELVRLLSRADRGRPLPVYRGSASAIEMPESTATPAVAALREALRAGPLTLIALGPLTNIAAALDGEPGLRANVARVIAVMGRRPGHLFHPAEGGSHDAMLFGHGPIFRDFNFEKDRAAVARLLDMGLPTTLVPYDAGRSLVIDGEDLMRMESRGGAAAWAASRARGWLRFWNEEIGKEGFHPFDVLAAMYVVAPHLLRCAETSAWVADDDKLWGWIYGPESLLVGTNSERPTNFKVDARVLYCPRADGALHDRGITHLVDGLPK